MREGNFIKQNLERWESYQHPTEDPDETAKRFTYLVDDLAYAKTFYPFSNTVKYINGIAANIYLSIYKNKKEKKNKFVTFWKTDLPLTIRSNHKLFLFAFLFFLAFVFIGVFSSYYDPHFIRSVLGDQYVDMTEQNIANGDPFGVYKRENETSMFVSIAFHNISVSLLMYITGLLANIGTLFFLFKNGLMVGVFEYMFFHHNMGFKSILVIFTHGTLELSSIVIASTAGLILGNSLLFPRTFTRLQSFKRGAKDSMKVALTLVPLLIMAAFFEGFVTRHTEMPVWGSLCILGGSATIITWYFIIYPIRVSKKIKNNVPSL